MKQPIFRFLALGWSLVALGIGAFDVKGDVGTPAPSAALSRATVLIIRHAEEPDHGDGLSPAGEAHANAYVSYFESYSINGVKPIQLTALFAAANSSSSHRPVLTLTPLSLATGLPIDSEFKDDSYAKLADALQTTDHGRCIVVCWHHGNIPNLVRALGGDPRELLPDGKWPDDQYGWVIQLHYDRQGLLKSSKRVVENL